MLDWVTISSKRGLSGFVFYSGCFDFRCHLIDIIQLMFEFLDTN